MATEKTQKNASIYFCNFCDYNTSNKTDYNRHQRTQKHARQQMATFGNNLATEKTHICDICSKSYKDRTGLWKHKKKCLSSEKKTQDEETINKEDIILMVLKQNAELIEIVKNGTHNIINNTTHTNSHNKAFNLNLFLNETCKNAMNINDFVDSIKLQLSDFIEVGEVGYVQGISNIIIKNLNSLDETIRPIHCTDQKRETFYIKDENKWEKEEEDMKKIRKMIKKVSYKNEKLMMTYKDKYPDYNNPESKRSDQYSKTVIEALGGIGENDKEKEHKIIRNICKVTQIKNKK